MVTFHAIVRGFVGEFRHIQLNAIRSWLKIDPDGEAVLFGTGEEGAPEAVALLREEGLRVGLHYIKRNDDGVPLVSSHVELARQYASNEIRCLINADCVLMPDFLWAVERCAARFGEFLLVCQRWGLQVDRELGFEDEWYKELSRVLVSTGKPKHRGAIDYFCYRGDFWQDCPPFAVGRTSWDNWLVWKALVSGVPVVDGTQATTVLHQEHAKKRKQQETDANRALYTEGVGARAFSGSIVAGLNDATYALMNNGAIVPTNSEWSKYL